MCESIVGLVEEDEEEEIKEELFIAGTTVGHMNVPFASENFSSGNAF